jgi:hypothetical protein
MMKPEIMVCQCTSIEHQVVYWRDPEDAQVYMSVYLSPLPLTERIKAAFKYIFGYKCKYGHWEEFVLGEEHREDLLKIAATLGPNTHLNDSGHNRE